MSRVVCIYGVFPRFVHLELDRQRQQGRKYLFWVKYQFKEITEYDLYCVEWGVQARDILRAMFQLSKEIRLD